MNLEALTVNVTAYDKAQEENDFSLIAELLRTRPEIIEPYLFEVVADKIEGKWKAPLGRPVDKAKKEAAQRQALEIYDKFLEQTLVQRIKPDSVQFSLSKEYKIAESTIRLRIKDAKALVEGREPLVAVNAILLLGRMFFLNEFRNKIALYKQKSGSLTEE